VDTTMTTNYIFIYYCDNQLHIHLLLRQLIHSPSLVMDSSIQFCSSFLISSDIEFIRKQVNELVKTVTALPNFHIFDEILTCITDMNYNEMI